MMIPILTRLNPNDPDTRQGNPGDYYILLGVQHLLQEVIGGEPEWLLVSKFDKDHAVSHLESLREHGLLVYAGMPQYNRFSDWCYWYDEGLWSDLVEPSGAKVICLAGGAGYSSTSIAPSAFADLCRADARTTEVMELRAKSTALFTARDPYAHAFLEAFEIESHLLPCSAIFAGKRVRSRTDEGDLCLVVPPGHRSLCIGDGDKEERMASWVRRLCAALRDSGRSPVVVCNCGREWALLKDELGLDVRYSNNYLWQLRMYERCSEMVGARIHAVLPTYGMGKARCVGVSVDTRGSALGILPGVPTRSFYDIEDDPSVLVSDLDAATPCDPTWLKGVEDSYVELIRGALSHVASGEGVPSRPRAAVPERTKRRRLDRRSTHEHRR